MNISLLAFASALFCGALAFSVFRNEKRNSVHMVFSGGMLLFGIDAVFSGLSWESTSINEIFIWQCWRLLTFALLPGVWLYFSLSYSRGNQRDFLSRWKFILGGTFLIPLALAGLAYNSLIVPVKDAKSGQWMLGLGQSGFFLTLIFLITTVLVLMNLERTFRAAMGTMRWRIKFMIIGLGMLFAVRAFTSSQTLLTHIIDPRLQVVDAGALFVACILILRSLFREGHFEINVYPSHSVLQSSLTVFLAGIYFLIIGVLWKAVTFLGGNTEFEIKAFMVLVAIVVLTVVLLSDRARLHVNRFISRHFQRPLYDYRTVWRKFTEATASCVNQTQLCQAAIKSATDIFQALSVTVNGG